MEAGAVQITRLETLANQMIALLEEVYNRMQYVESPNYQVTYDDYLLYRGFLEQMRDIQAQIAQARQDAIRDGPGMADQAFQDMMERMNEAGRRAQGVRDRIAAYRRESQQQQGGKRRRKTLRKRK